MMPASINFPHQAFLFTGAFAYTGEKPIQRHIALAIFIESVPGSVALFAHRAAERAILPAPLHRASIKSMNLIPVINIFRTGTEVLEAGGCCGSDDR